MHNTISEFRSGWKSSEFIRLVIVFFVILLAQFHVEDFTVWSRGLACLCAAYAISRGIFKKSRLQYVGKGEMTSEFWVTFAGISCITGRWFIFGGISLTDVIIGVVICEAGYQLSRGIGKSYTPRDVKLPLGLR